MPTTTAPLKQTQKRADTRARKHSAAAGTVTQDDLASYALLQSNLRELKRRYEAETERLILAFVNGARVQDGALAAELTEHERHYVDWKGIVEEDHGLSFIQQTLAESEPTRFYTVEVKVKPTV